MEGRSGRKAFPWSLERRRLVFFYLTIHIVNIIYLIFID